MPRTRKRRRCCMNTCAFGYSQGFCVVYCCVLVCLFVACGCACTSASDVVGVRSACSCSPLVPHRVTCTHAWFGARPCLGLVVVWLLCCCWAGVLPLCCGRMRPSSFVRVARHDCSRARRNRDKNARVSSAGSSLNTFGLAVLGAAVVVCMLLIIVVNEPACHMGPTFRLMEVTSEGNVGCLPKVMDHLQRIAQVRALCSPRGGGGTTESRGARGARSCC